MKQSALILGLTSAILVLNTLPLFPNSSPFSPPAAQAFWGPPAPEFVREHSGIREFKLQNGMKVLLVENHAAPVVSVMVVYKVGSRNEAVGYTGSTHFLEHMLFKGTPTFNKDKGTQIAQTLQAQGANFNATTWLDRTNYFETLPADKLELALKIEADRMRNSFVSEADRQSEMSVVRNELERGENNPGRVMWLNLWAHAFMAHPYHHPTIGWRSDVEGVPTERLKKFYEDFYYPNNASLILVGDFEEKSTLDKLNQFFGVIKASEKPIPEVYTQEPPQQGERRFVIRRPGQLGIVNIGYHVPPLESQDSYALDILDGLLSTGVTSRLHQALVEKQLASSAYSYNAQLRDPGLFILNAMVASGVKHETVEAALLETLENLKKQPPTLAEIDKIRNQIKARFSFERHGTSALASTLGEYEASADWRYMVTYLDKLAQVKPADIQKIAQKYFIESNRTVGYFIPEATPEVAANQRDVAYQNLKAELKQTQTIASRGQAMRFPLGNQGRLIVLENHLDNTVAIRGSIQAGSVNDPPGKRGLATLTAGMLDKGSKRSDKLALAEKLEQMGSSLSFSNTLEQASFSGTMLSENLSETLKILSEMLKEPAFPAEEFEKLKKQTMDRLSQELEDTDTQATELLNTQLYPPGHPHHQTTAALLKDLQGITLADVKDFYKTYYGSRKLVLTVVGDVNTQVIQNFAQTQLNGWNPQNREQAKVPAVAMQKQGQTQIKTMKDKANVSIMLGLQADLTLTDPNYFAALIANHALGQSSLSSRLGLKVRDELGLTYGIFSYFSDIGLGSGPWLVGVTTNPNNVQKTIDATKGVIETYRQEGITQKEFEIAKSSLIGSYLVNLSTNAQLASRLTDIEFYGQGDDYLQRRAEKIQAVTREQVNQMIQKYFAPHQLSIGIAGNYEAN